MIIQEEGEVIVIKLSERDIIQAIYLHYNFPRRAKMEIIINKDGKDKLSAVIKIP